MIKSFFKTAIRNLARHKLFTFINVIGLSIGISAALVIYLIVYHDFTFDKFHPDGNRIYRVVTNLTFSGETASNRGVSGALPAAVSSDVPGIESSAPFYELSDLDIATPTSSKEPLKFKKQSNIILADGRYFDIFKYRWLAGSSKTALNSPYKVVLTEKRAKLYFPNLTPEQVMGKVVTYEDTIHAAVSGIVADFTENSDFRFHDFISYSTGNAVTDLKSQMELDFWPGTNSSSQYFVRLYPGVDPAVIAKKVLSVYRAHYTQPESKGNGRSYALQALGDIHFNTAYWGVGDSGAVSKSTLYGLLLIAAFLLLLACINFINLTTAQASQRAKEIGIRKTIGSTRPQLIVQLLSETLLITLIAIIISVIATPFILKLFTDFISPDIKFNLLQQPGIIAFLLALTIVVSLLSGFYPALVLSGYKPVDVLKNKTASGNGKTRTMWLRKSLTVTQFVIAQFFIMATLLISKQIYYALHKDLGFKKDAIVFVNTPWKKNTESQKQLFYNKINAIPEIELVSRGGVPPSSNNYNSTEATYKDGKKETKLEIIEKFADENYIKVYNIKLLAGRNLQRSDTGHAFLVNAAYTKIIGFKNPADAVGKIVDNFNGDTRMRIAGVVADFHTQSLHAPVSPLAILNYPEKSHNDVFHLLLKPHTAGGDEWKTALYKVEKAWKEVYPEADFDYQFFDESIAKLYVSEQRTSQLLTWASGLSILISCLGLLGLAIYTTNTRTKEIGVRKVLGASVSQIVTLLSTELITLVILAFIIVTPIAYWAMHQWMQNFADRTPISWWLFGLSGAAMLLTALLTLSSQTIRAAIASPVRSLRSE